MSNAITLDEMKANPLIVQRLRLDLTPADIFRPRFGGPTSDGAAGKDIEGFMLYIDYTGTGKPTLMLMKTYLLTSKTFAEVVGVPEEMLIDVITSPGIKEITGMYPIDEAVIAWVKQGLGI